MIKYVLTKDVYQRLLSFKGKERLVCRRCSLELKIGELVKGSRNSGTSKLYHSKCYESLFINVRD
jgi:hypothetical protein